jgi:predicted MPP superfamily phosphohydrolase
MNPASRNRSQAVCTRPEPDAETMDDATILDALEHRLGRVHARQRLGIETDHEAHVFGEGIGFFHLENWYSAHSFIRNSLRVTGLLGRARRNALDIRVARNTVNLRRLPAAFDGFTLLHLSDLHLDINGGTSHAIAERVRGIDDYDACVLTGDYRAKTFGAISETLHRLETLRVHLRDPVFAVLGNHDSIRMVPAIEAMGIRVLLNESVAIEREHSVIHLSGIDDAHYFRVDSIEKAVADLPDDGFRILLSHTPEIYRQATHAGFDLMLCGHTHGGQICLPGGRPVILDAKIPRRLGRGQWEHHSMVGYTSPGAGTSIVDVRLNCPAEITVHRLRRGQEAAPTVGQ